METYASILIPVREIKNGGEAKAAGVHVQRMMATVPHIIQFITACVNGNNLGDSFAREAVGVVGDLIDIYGAEVKPALPTPFCKGLVEKAVVESYRHRATVRYARNLMTKIGIVF